MRYEHGEKHADFHVPTTVADYRAVYKAYLHDPDIQDARAYFPFVPMWDNHEFSWQGWQSLVSFGKGGYSSNRLAKSWRCRLGSRFTRRA